MTDHIKTEQPVFRSVETDDASIDSGCSSTPKPDLKAKARAETQAEPNTQPNSPLCIRRVDTLENIIWRKCCRQVLAAHIAQQIGTTIDINTVELLTTGDEAYKWQYPPSCARWFRRPIDRLDARTCQELVCAVGHAFQAVAHDHDEAAEPAATRAWSQVQVIEDLNDKVHRLRASRSDARARLAGAEDELREVEEQAQQLRNTLQHKAIQERQQAKTLSWLQGKRELTDYGLQSIRTSLSALLHEVDLLVVRTQHVNRT